MGKTNMKSTKLLFVIGLCVLLCMNLFGCSPVLKEDVKLPQENPYTYEEESKLISSVGSESKSFADAEFFDHDNLHFCKLGSTVLLKSGGSKDDGMSGFNIRLSTAFLRCRSATTKRRSQTTPNFTLWNARTETAIFFVW